MHDAGPVGHFLAFECLRGINRTAEQIRLIANYVEGLDREDKMLRVAAGHLRAYCDILIAYLEPDPSMSVGFALSRLREMRRSPPIEAVIMATQKRR